MTAPDASSVPADHVGNGEIAGALGRRLIRLLGAAAIPIGAIIVSMLLFGVFVAIVGVNPLDVYASIYKGAFGSWFSWQNTLQRAAPLLLTALCTALPAR